MKTFASIFTGGDLAGVGAFAAGLTPIWGVEIDPDIAAVAEMNSKQRMIVGKAQDVGYSLLESPYWLHASPPCINASVAKQDARETELDLEMAGGVAFAIAKLQPPMFSLENVWKYREFESFKMICAVLESQGYNFRFWHLNSADYGVPQTRKRLILVASRIRKVEKPQATHRQHGDMFLPSWIGWYAAIEDLIHTLPESKFAEWQLKRLPENCKTFLAPSLSVDVQERDANQPSYTIVAASHIQTPRAFIAHPNADNDWFITRDASEPVFTVKANGNGIPRGFILSDQTNSGGAKVTQREIGSPVFTIDTRDSHKVRAFLIDRCNSSNAQVREQLRPSFTTTVYSPKHQPPQAWLEHDRVVSMTPRALARFQSIPDFYKFPEKISLACRVIGNAVPPLLMQRTVEANL